MTREEAISIMNVIVHMLEPQYDTDRIEDAVDMAIKALEQNESAEEWYKLFVEKLEQEPKTGWIPVSERLPEDTQSVLLTIRRMSKLYNHEPFITVGHISWNQTTWWCAHDGDCVLNEIEVIAWMPLPKPYEPQESDHKCHTCKHYTSGEHDGSCGSYICKGYSNLEREDMKK